MKGVGRGRSHDFFQLGELRRKAVVVERALRGAVGLRARTRVWTSKLEKDAGIRTGSRIRNMSAVSNLAA